jgi:sugar lactone lactonase YvrE
VAGLALVLTPALWFRSLASRVSPPAHHGPSPALPGKSETAQSLAPTQIVHRFAPEPASLGPPPFGRRVTRRIIQYGPGEGEIGLIRKDGQTPVGPESFALDPKGNLLIADRVNHRVVIYDRNGAAMRSLELPGVNLNDLTSDDAGRLYVYDQIRSRLNQYDPDGRLLSRLNLDPGQISTRGYFHVVRNAVYFADAAQRDVLVGTLQEGILSPPSGLAERASDGVHGASGRLYSVAVAKGEGLRLQIRDPDAPSFARAGELGVPDVLAARYAGEDAAHRCYVQVERWLGDKVALEVAVFGPDGEHLGRTPLPENDYALWTAKLVEAGADGTLVQFLPAEAEARVSLFERRPATN